MGQAEAESAADNSQVMLVKNTLRTVVHLLSTMLTFEEHRIARFRGHQRTEIAAWPVRSEPYHGTAAAVPPTGLSTSRYLRRCSESETPPAKTRRQRWPERSRALEKWAILQVHLDAVPLVYSPVYWLRFGHSILAAVDQLL